MARPGTDPPDVAASMRAGKRAATLLPACPLMHGTGLFITLSTLSGGGTVVLLDTLRLDAEAVWSAIERERVQVCTIDEAQWLDSESLDVLTFAARRLQAESVAMLFAMRDDPRLDVWVAGIPTLRLSGLDPMASVVLLSASVPDTIDPLVAAQIARSTGGNPLALIDLAQELSIKQLTESGLTDEPIPIGHHLEAHYVRQARQMAPAVICWRPAFGADASSMTRASTCSPDATSCCAIS